MMDTTDHERWQFDVGQFEELMTPSRFELKVLEPIKEEVQMRVAACRCVSLCEPPSSGDGYRKPFTEAGMSLRMSDFPLVRFRGFESMMRIESGSEKKGKKKSKNKEKTKSGHGKVGFSRNQHWHI